MQALPLLQMSQKPNKDALGKGIRSLLKTIDEDLKTTSGKLQPAVAEATTVSLRIPLQDIEVNPKQPRRDFDETALQELAASIRLHDIIQPITVSKTATGKYRLIAGERRWRASKLAGLKDIPAYIRLLKLPPDIQLAVRSGALTMGHARALINIDTVEKQMFVYKAIKEKDLSVRQTEALVRQLYKPAPAKKTKKSELDRVYQQITDKLSEQFSTKVILKHDKKGSGHITIEYFSLDQFNHILKQLGVTVE